jgi:hypothetical protein
MASVRSVSANTAFAQIAIGQVDTGQVGFDELTSLHIGGQLFDGSQIGVLEDHTLEVGATEIAAAQFAGKQSGSRSCVMSQSRRRTD